MFSMLLVAGCGSWTASSLAQDSVDIGELEVTGQSLGNGQMVQEEAAKSRSTVTREALEKMSPTGNGIDKLKYTPGLNVSSDDSSGLSGFNFSMRGMQSDQVGVTMDGIPINDSGNYALYPNLLGDPDNLAEVFATQGSAEIDGPHIGSSGGNIGLVSMRPTKDFGVAFKQTLGSNNLQKTFVRLNTGEYMGLSNYISVSKTQSDKWKGKGELDAEKVELNSLYKFGEGNSLNAIIKYHKQENNRYATASLAQYRSNHQYEFAETPVYNANTGKLSTASYKTSVNPFENVTASLTGRFQLRDDLQLTVAPYYYWANGGSYSAYGSPATLYSTTNSSGNYDLSNLNTSAGYNADGDPVSGRYYRPSWTETWRPGINSKLTWALNDDHSLDIGYWYERARQRQTQPFISLKADGSPTDIWADSNAAVDANGVKIQGRNYFTVTPVHKLFIQDTWYATADLTLTGGLAYEYSERDGNMKASLYDTPEKRNATYHEFLPNFSAKYQLDTENSVFYNLTRNMRTPPNYVLYNAGDSISLDPELSWNNELGWRYASDSMALSATLFYLQFENRQISSRNQDGDYEMLNAGKVENKGLELEFSGLLPHDFNYYASYTYTEAEQQEDILYYGVYVPTKGKQVASVPKNLFNLSLGYDNGRWYGNVIGKFVDNQYGDLTNDQSIPHYTVVDMNVGYRLPVNKNYLQSATVRLSMNNVFNREYLAGVNTVVVNSARYNGTGSTYAGAQTPYYTIGEEQTVAVTFEANF
ncbi:TonB-dependent receptor [Stutzerimonas kirkiae]|uniref:TonB-dependent receptor n=2 Tax=Stutzerimonas kirkiae TaxID=2211392 RepID=A0A4Q9R5J3_9GAMM|nr:TonB-dependent receptor [Stutzerimonas kirkiae]TBV02782.1 TonB-dependent receptor [Stutzerimonas kirkiae]TBV03724.1 TonB-dependent receptor [Stutzerimonas kirkiae]TBV13295.1 TonB-dependent receptor [Stutzerimonas kirkiae]